MQLLGVATPFSEALCVYFAFMENANTDLKKVNSWDTLCAKCQHVFSRTLIAVVIGSVFSTMLFFSYLKITFSVWRGCCNRPMNTQLSC